MPVGSLLEPLMIVLGASKTRKIWFSNKKITFFVNVVVRYFEALDVLLGPIFAHLVPIWSQNGPKNGPQNHTKTSSKTVPKMHMFLSIVGTILALFWTQAEAGSGGLEPKLNRSRVNCLWGLPLEYQW